MLKSTPILTDCFDCDELNQDLYDDSFSEPGCGCPDRYTSCPYHAPGMPNHKKPTHLRCSDHTPKAGDQTFNTLLWRKRNQ
jgi:hypothetical protein